MEQIPEFLNSLKPFYDIGSTGLLVIVIVMIFTGRLLPRSVVQFWIDAYNGQRDANTRLLETNRLLAQSSAVSARALDSLPPADGGEPDVATTTETRRRRRQGQG